jgi:hypothetical protein
MARHPTFGRYAEIRLDKMTTDGAPKCGREGLEAFCEVQINAPLIG